MGSTESAVSLPGSDFEIDDDANLINDPAPPNPLTLDWAVVEETRKLDEPTGANDNSYGGGAKEADACPTVGTGSIPNNKSDLTAFGAYVEPGAAAGDPGYFHLFWTRVQEPSGTTLMDFELNQSSTDCGNGVNPVRTPGDLLIEYRLEQGGAIATIKVREWEGTAWGAATDLTAAAGAVGSINTSVIPEAESDGLAGPEGLSVRTFGEASIDLDFIFDEGKCTSFGSAFVKSRSSDSFTSQLKDFIAPVPIALTNCGKVVIRKETDPPDLDQAFGFTHNLNTDPVQSEYTFSLEDGEAKTFTNVLPGTNYTVTEEALAGFELESIVCTNTDVTPGIDVTNRKVTFDIDSATDVLDCTFTNRARGKIVIEKITNDGAGTFPFTGALGAFSLTTTGPGEAGKDAETFDDLDPGTYDVAETVPAGWNLVSATCDDGSDPASISLGAGETVTCTFVNQRQRGAIRIVKKRKHAADGEGNHPHAGVTFQISGGDLSDPVDVVTGADGVACLDNLVLSSFVGAYAVTEVVPFGYEPAGATSLPVSVTTEASCPAGDPVSFLNIPLTEITVSVNSLVDGGTKSTITCTGLPPFETGPGGDGTLTLGPVQPGTYTCTIVVDP